MIYSEPSGGLTINPPKTRRVRRLAAGLTAGATMLAGLLLALPSSSQAATSDWADPTYKSWTGPDGKAVQTVLDTAGRTLVLTAANQVARVTRLLPGGGVDPAYGSRGVSVALPGHTYGQLAVVGERALVLSSDQVTHRISVTRLTPSGVLDPAYGTGGRLLLPAVGSGAWYATLATRPDGSAVAFTGIGDQGSQTNRSALRGLTAAGAVDTGFGSRGLLTVPGLVTQLKLAADTLTVGVDGYRLRRYTASGATDPSFGIDGERPAPSGWRVTDLAVADGRTYLALDNSQGFIAAARLGGDGELDPGFGPGGGAGTDIGIGGAPEGSVFVEPAGPSCWTSPTQIVPDGENAYLLSSPYDCDGPLRIHHIAGGTLDEGFGAEGALVIHSISGRMVTGGTAVRLDDGRLGLALETTAVRPQDGPNNGVRTVTTALLKAVPEAVPGTYVPLPPTRILDTRAAIGWTPHRAVAAGEDVYLRVAGAGGVPVTARAVTMNVTVVDARAGCAVSVFPRPEAGAAAPVSTSSINCRPGRTIANQVTVGVGAEGEVILRGGSTGPLHLVADVSGYYRGGEGEAAGTFVPVAPSRRLDTRSGMGAPVGPVRAGGTLDVQIAGLGGVPSTNVSAVVANLTAVAPGADTAITAFPTGVAPPGVSSLNTSARVTRANLVTVRLGTGGRVSLRNGSAGATHLLLDVTGYYVGGTPTAGGSYVALNPARVLDTRTGVGAPRKAVAAGTPLTLTVGGRAGVPTTAVGALVLNTTVTTPTGNGLVTAFPAGFRRPTASTLNYLRGETVANSATVMAATGASVDLHVAGTGGTHLIADVSGYFRD